MDSFKVGDKVIYPNQGLGIIEDIQEESYYGEKFRIYHLRILSNDTLVLVPSSNAEEIGIRKPVSAGLIRKIFEFMRNGDVDITMNWKGRYKEHLNLLKSGLMLDMALVLKSLYYLNQTPLFPREENDGESKGTCRIRNIRSFIHPFLRDRTKTYGNLSSLF